ncbi:MAG: hypothetical protein EOO65_02815 [Methanosarcinales archaeon]|nr:MAG: hypothetical protein EOO65_02815 [Methanosarcinales archaeon]
MGMLPDQLLLPDVLHVRVVLVPYVPGAHEKVYTDAEEMVATTLGAVGGTQAVHTMSLPDHAPDVESHVREMEVP